MTRKPHRAGVAKVQLPHPAKPVHIPVGWVGTVTFGYILLSMFDFRISHALGIAWVAVIVLGVNAFLTLAILYRAWSAIQDGHERTTPRRAIAFLLIPLFNLYWIFVALAGYAKDFNAFTARHHITARRLSERLFTTYCVLLILGIGVNITQYVLLTLGIGINIVPLIGSVYAAVLSAIGLINLWDITSCVNEVYAYVNKSARPDKTKELVGYIILGVCLCVVALRTMFTEGPAMQSSTQAVNLGDNLYSLSVSAVLIISFVVWVVWSFCSGRLAYRPAGIEIALGLFCIAAIVAGCAAPDKRLVITDIAMLGAPLLTAWLLVQLLDSQAKIKLVLAVIAALGVVSAYQCAEQFFVSNQITIEQYEENAQSVLEPLGIEVGSFQQFMFEHRLYSRGVRGFFTTRNSAGSFAVMAFFAAVALFIDKFKHHKSDPSIRLYLFGCGLTGIVILFSLALTRSKGAIGGLVFSTAVFATLLLFGNGIRTHRKAILAVCLLLAIAGGWAAVSYGLHHGHLPGGVSMLVRWQYWHAAAQMVADHPLTGVGPGNFAHFYTHYKPAAAPESVADPHNFPLSLLTQYGPLGLAAFLAMLFIPLWSALSPVSAEQSVKRKVYEPAFRNLAAGFLIVISLGLLIIRPILMPKTPTEDLAVILYVIVTVYIAPVAVFIIAFLLVAGPLRKTQNTNDDVRNSHTAAALFCAVIGVALHNLTDFALFEPGVFTTLWAIIAILIAVRYETHQSAQPQISPQGRILQPGPAARIAAATAGLILIWVYQNYTLFPLIGSTAKIRQANKAISIGQFDYAHELLDKAAQDDALSSAGAGLNGRLYLHHFQVAGGKNPDLLLRAEESLKAAIERNDVAYRNYERLSEVYCRLATISTEQEKTDWLNKALATSSLAIDRYPGCGRLHLQQAQIAEQLGQTKVAIEQYKKTIDIEDQYRAQFRRMYPDRDKVVSRLGEEQYNLAKQKLQILSRH